MRQLVSFDGSLARCVSLSAGEKVTFQYEGGDGLKAAVKKDGETLMEIADGAVFTAPEKGQYRFTVEGEAKEGAFSLFWQSE